MFTQSLLKDADLEQRRRSFIHFLFYFHKENTMHCSRVLILVLVVAALGIPAVTSIAAPENPDRGSPYPHFYCTGELTPGSIVKGKIVGKPGTTPVGLFLGFSLLDPPMNHMWGLFHLNSPWFLIGPLGMIPKDGVMTLGATLPSTSGPYDVCFQALIGDELSNAFIMEVRDIVPSGMTYIYEGGFEMGDHHGVGWPNELPVHKVTLDSFQMDVFEVTNQEYCNFLNKAYGQGSIIMKSGTVVKNGTGQPYLETDLVSSYSSIHWDGASFSVHAGMGYHPVVCVSWYGTSCYDLATWKCNMGADGYRLPTEAEWEFAARGGETSDYYMYPWGADTIDGSNANYLGSGDPFDDGSTPVGYYNGNQIPAGSNMGNGHGLYDMAGNVWEYCNDWYDEFYYSSSPVDNPQGPATGTFRVVRGGSSYFGIMDQRCARREVMYPHICNVSAGIRLVKR
jgi:formylglycine-generating enzyme required for sulfatase activity